MVKLKIRIGTNISVDKSNVFQHKPKGEIFGNERKRVFQ